MRNPEIGFPRRLCFSNHDLARRDCRNCEQAEPCMDEQAGFSLSEFLKRCGQVIEVEQSNGGVPDWVLEVDGRIITDEDLETFRHDNPGLYQEYLKFNGIPEG